MLSHNFQIKKGNFVFSQPSLLETKFEPHHPTVNFDRKKHLEKSESDFRKSQVGDKQELISDEGCARKGPAWVEILNETNWLQLDLVSLKSFIESTSFTFQLSS